MSSETVQAAPSTVELETALGILQRLMPEQRDYIVALIAGQWVTEATGAQLIQLIVAGMQALSAREDKLRRQVREWAEEYVGQVGTPAMVELEKLVGEID